MTVDETDRDLADAYVADRRSDLLVDAVSVGLQGSRGAVLALKVGPPCLGDDRQLRVARDLCAGIDPGPIS